MIVEHIIDPFSLVELAKSPRNCKDFEREFTKPSPRVIGDFPKFKRLRRLSYDAQAHGVPDLEKKRLEALLDFVNESSKVNRETSYDGALSLENNILQVEKYCFEGIFFMSNDRLDQSLMCNKIYPINFEQGIQSLPTQILTPKTAPLMCEKLGELLRLSQHIVLVDPYITGSSNIWQTVIAFIEHAVTSSPVESKTFSLRFSSDRNKNAPSCDSLKNKLLETNAGLAAKYNQIEFLDIKENGQEGIHNRYLITELGAITLPYGFNETNENESDDAMLLGVELYEKRYSQFFEGEAFDEIDKAVIE